MMSFLFEFYIFAGCFIVSVISSDGYFTNTRESESYNKEVFIFSAKSLGSVQSWKTYNWEKITTLAVTGYNSSDIEEIVKTARKYGTKVVSLGFFPGDSLQNSTAKRVWVNDMLEYNKKNSLNGINIDFESIIKQGDISMRDGLTELVKETFSAFKNLSIDLQVSVDIPYTPGCLGYCWYDFESIANFSDFLVVMAYDEQSQITGACIAGANSGYYRAYEGLHGYFRLGIPPSKLILAVPWYGYSYTCLTVENDTCFLRPFPFRGAPCSSANETQYSYSYIKHVFLRHAAPPGRLWDEKTLSPYMRILIKNQWYYIWYDDTESLLIKYSLLYSQGIRGIGVWNAQNLDPQYPTDVKEMWNALPIVHKMPFRNSINLLN